ncbi:hypothetical protein WOLCODRAFT_120564 [Wolfiporia cocos MD-104 SS10]|uniref:Zn(2)-C6 fungal-type domain-containing protein n=1 Tax=Wolfiporia cocos (strain MD-104) TaxID=742152 RepID=A0A2H3K0A8_WOLCO|nr:hypothetical protein WOLCODRAFT_120564 [Wolfiporia cocos MD-104 SS10]
MFDDGTHAFSFSEAHQQQTMYPHATFAPNGGQIGMESQATSRPQASYETPGTTQNTGWSGGMQMQYTQPSVQLSGFAKRPRIADDVGAVEMFNDEMEGEWEAEGGNLFHGREEEQKPRPQGACARCKGLKVRCEMVGDSCKRCQNGGHECVVPGRKKRRPPPKREHLIKEINEQAARIQDLMRQLEDANRRAARRHSGGVTPHTAGPTRGRNSSVTTSDLAASIGGINHSTPPPERDVEDWIKKARQSMEDFGGYINMGGPSVTVGMLGEDGSIQGEESDDEYEEEPDLEETEQGPRVNVENTVAPASADSPESATSEGGRPRASYSRASTESLQDGPPRRAAEKLATIPSEATAFGLFAGLSIRKSRGRNDANEDDHEARIGLANDNYFRASPAPEQPLVDEQQQPAILRNGIIKPVEAEKLFHIYFEYMNLSLSLLDPALYTAQKTYWRSPFLFTVICAIASRHYPERPELYPEAMKYARLAAGTALIGGQKNIEVVQAYILLSLYPVPAQRWEDDRSFIYLGLAIRVATDLKLHYANAPKAQNEMHAREMLNRTRVWLNCFNLDRSTGSQYGQRPIIDNRDYVANHTEDWWCSSPYNMEGFDVHLCCYNAELKVMADFRGRIYSNPNHPTGLNKDVDLAQVAKEYDDRLAHLWETWIPRVRAASRPDDKQAQFRSGLLKLAFSYARLSVLSVGFQHSFGKATPTSEVPFLWRCLRAATDTVRAIVDEIGIPSQKIYLRHGPEAQSVFVTFASAFLIKLLQPKYAQYLSRTQRVEIRDLVQRVIDLLGSPEVAVDDRHGPKLYSRFLSGLLSMPNAQIDYQPPKREPGHRRTPSKTPSSTSSPLARDALPLSARGSLSPPPTSSSSNSPKQPITPPPASPLSSQFYQAVQTPPGGAIISQPSPPTDLEAPGFFSPPLFYDSELLQSMQSVADSSAWPDMVLPGFNWMGSMQPEPIPALRVDEPIMGLSGAGYGHYSY